MLVAIGEIKVGVGAEEPNLKKRFGAAEEDYLKQVPRWIPGLKSNS